MVDFNLVRYVGEKHVAEITQRKVQTLRNDRFRGWGIPYIKIGRQVRYKLADVIQFMEAHRVEPSKES